MNKLSTNRMYRDLIRNRTLNGEFHIECIECGKLFVPESPLTIVSFSLLVEFVWSVKVVN